MARDEAILKAVSAGDSLPTLRLYAWNPACLSLGYGQHSREADFDRLATYGWDIVRRPTGGKAILHTDELTYSLSLPADHPLATGDVVESYRRISRALTAGLRALGLATQADQQTGLSSAVGPVCFETPSHYEITAGGRKLIGSAQVRRKSGILQHGTLPLYGDLSRICDALVYTDENSRAAGRLHVHARAITLEEALKRRVLWEEAAAAIVQGFAETFDLAFSTGDLSPAEQEEAKRLAATYGGLEHIRRR